MAARNFKKNMGHYTPEPVTLFSKSTGAAAADHTALRSAGVASVKYNAATGKVKVTLEDKWNELLFVAGSVIDATTPDDWEIVVEAETVATTKIISLACFKGGTLTDLTTDDKLMLQIVLSNTAKIR